jgi:hypothetical protein
VDDLAHGGEGVGKGHGEDRAIRLHLFHRDSQVGDERRVVEPAAGERRAVGGRGIRLRLFGFPHVLW